MGTRYTVDFSTEAADKLEGLSSKLHTSKTEVIRRALAMYNYLIKEVAEKRDKRLVIVDEDKDTPEKEIVFVNERV